MTELRLLLMVAAMLPGIMSGSAMAQGLEYADKQLANPAEEAEATALMYQLRCVQCQGQSIGDSDAPIAAVMRDEVRRQVKAGKSAQEIRRFFISRYGEYVSFEPSARGTGLLLWAAPLLLLAIALLVSVRLFRRARR